MTTKYAIYTPIAGYVMSLYLDIENWTGVSQVSMIAEYTSDVDQALLFPDQDTCHYQIRQFTDNPQTKPVAVEVG